MKLKQKDVHLSIINLPETTLPDFTLLTGVNGVGKTHLLRAIEVGKVGVDIAADFKSDIRYFDWTNLFPNNAKESSAHQIGKQKLEAWRGFERHQASFRTQVVNTARNLGFPSDFLNDFERLASVPQDDCTELFGPETAAAKYEQLQKSLRKASSGIREKLVGRNRNPHWCNQLFNKNPNSLISLSEKKFYEDLPLIWDQVSAFQQSFASLFVSYRDRKRENDLRRLCASDGDTEANPLSNEAFVDRYGIPPWEFVNDTLKNARLEFTIDSPDPYRDLPYVPRLTKTDTGAEVSFADLSSGEKVLMSFALCLYYTKDKRQLATYPKVLLLDEVDAPLHPSMSKTLLDATTKTLVGNHGIKVLMTTHSPSTVALAPEEAVHVMKANPQQIEKVSKEEALSVLTDGVPTISISFDGRRQVFVESQHDAKAYSALYEVLKPQLRSSRSLSFIAIGHETGGGCDKVKDIVKRLAGSGNKSVFGLLDWDLGNTPGDRVFVLSHGKHYAIENLLFDPLIVAALIARDVRSRLTTIGLGNDEGHLSIPEMDHARQQSIVCKVENALGFETPGPRETNSYDSISLEVLESYNRMQGHTLESKIVDHFPELRKFSSHEGDLKVHVINHVFRDIPSLIPKEFADVFNRLLNTNV
ncbi:ATP-dependent nuclease [Roseiconus lacunae]|uniref:ATP-dependent nuclease n=1 Tax=Roseiconus lacunae TaxID=2605694 RepID=UPI0011F282E5|nr:ATP-binding protein [Roseiconus lacunae]